MPISHLLEGPLNLSDEGYYSKLFVHCRKPRLVTTNPEEVAEIYAVGINNYSQSETGIVWSKGYSTSRGKHAGVVTCSQSCDGIKVMQLQQ